MRIYKNTIEHQGWDDDIHELAVYTTYPMEKREFVEYYNKNIAGTSVDGCEDYGIIHDIYRFTRSYDRVEKFPWLEYVLGKDDDYDDLKFSDDGDGYSFRRYSFNVIGLDADKEIYDKIMKNIRRNGDEE